MATPLHRTAAIILTLTLGTVALGAAGWAECAAAQAPSQAMMACCRDNPSCPMHEGPRQGAAAHQTVFHAETADCCTVSGAGGSTPGASEFLIPIASAPGPAPSASATLIAVPARPWRRPDIPVPPGPVARHILISVFQI